LESRELSSYLQKLTLFSTYSEPVDMQPIMEAFFSGKLGGTLMPPAPFVSRFRAPYTYDYDQEVARGTAIIKWIEPFHHIVRLLDQWQILGERSRLITLGIGRLQVREVRHRLERVSEALPHLRRVMITESVQEAIFHVIIEKTLKYMHYDSDWIRSYIKEHEGSSLGQQHRWFEAYSIDHSAWQQILSNLKSLLEYLNAHPGAYLNLMYNFGLRARAPPLSSLAETQDWEIDRSRIISFYPLLSMFTAFIPQKAAWYTEVLDEVYKLLHARVQIHYPYVLGGQIYTKVRDLFLNKPTFQAGDGKVWEAMTGTVLGRPFNPLMMKVGPYNVLPSGITFTSMLDTIANLIVNRNLSGDLIALGDDMNYWGPESIERVFSEVSPGDTRYGYILGVASGPIVSGARQYVTQPRLMGIRAMLDRRDKMVPTHLPPPGGINEDYDVERPYDPRMVSLYTGLYKGWFGARSLLDTLERIPPSEYVSPGETIENLVDTESGARVDAWAWAEQYGFKPVLTRAVKVAA